MSEIVRAIPWLKLDLSTDLMTSISGEVDLSYRAYSCVRREPVVHLGERIRAMSLCICAGREGGVEQSLMAGGEDHLGLMLSPGCNSKDIPAWCCVAPGEASPVPSARQTMEAAVVSIHRGAPPTRSTGRKNGTPSRLATTIACPAERREAQRQT